MSGDEKLRRIGVDRGHYATVITARIAAYVLHQDVGVLAFPSQFLREQTSQVASVAVAVDGTQCPELSQTLRHFHRADVAGVPNLIARLKVMQILVIPIRVGVADYAYSFHVIEIQVGKHTGRQTC